MGFGKKRSSKVGVGAITTKRKKVFNSGGTVTAPTRDVVDFEKYKSMTSDNKELSVDFKPLNFDKLISSGAFRVTNRGRDDGSSEDDSDLGFSIVSRYNDAVGGNTGTSKWKDNSKFLPVVREMFTSRPSDIGAHKYKQIVESAKDLGLTEDEIFMKPKSSGFAKGGIITTNKKKLFAEGGMMDDGKDVDPVSGNDVPTGSLAEEVRDDVDAKLSPGEFVFPADVVRFIGLERLMKMRDEAKKGLSRMNDIGQMGNAEDVGEEANDTYENEDEFESEIDDIMGEIDREETGDQTEMAFNAGGFVNPAYYDLSKAPKNPALDIRYFTDSEGKTFYMPFINGKPMKPMPNGAVQTGMPSGGDGKKTIPTTPGSSSDLKDFGKGLAVVSGATSTLPSGGGSRTDDTTAGAGTSVSVAGTYTGSNLADFGRSDMIYNVGGSGQAGELVTEDLWQNSAQKWQVNLGSAALSTLASAMGVPGILTLGLRAAANKYGVGAVNSFFARANQEAVAKAGGIDINRVDTFQLDDISSVTMPTGVAAAASQIDQLRDRGDTTTAGSAGALGTGGRAADVGQYVAQSLANTGLTDSEIAAAAQSAVNAVLRGKSMNDAVSEAITAAKPDFGVRLSDMDAAPDDEGSLYGGTFGVLQSDMDSAALTALSKDIGFDYSTMGSTTSTDTSKYTRDYKNQDEKFFDDIPDAFTLAGAGRLLERFETDEQRQN